MFAAAMPRHSDGRKFTYTIYVYYSAVYPFPALFRECVKLISTWEVLGKFERTSRLTRLTIEIFGNFQNNSEAKLPKCEKSELSGIFPGNFAFHSRSELPGNFAQFSATIKMNMAIISEVLEKTWKIEFRKQISLQIYA